MMDVDNDLDGRLLQQFSSLGTTDRDVLIAEFQKLLNNAISRSGCEFYLDMTNWNLHQAIGAYYDLEHPITTPSMTFVADVTIGEGEAVSPCTKFIKTWRLKNSGQDAWPLGCCLKFCSGENMGSVDRVMVDPLFPNHCCEISVEMTSPSTVGVYRGQWRMSTATGSYFGEVIWAIITVDEGGILGVTQQLSRIGGGFSYPSSETINRIDCSSETGTDRSVGSLPTSPVSASDSNSTLWWHLQPSIHSTHNRADHSEDVEMS